MRLRIARQTARRKTVVAVLALIASIGLVACGSSGGGSGNGAGQGELAKAGTKTLTVVPPSGAASTWNPMNTFAGYMYLNVYSTLLIRSGDGELAGYLASDWDASPTEINFTIKDGITCSDGTELTPSDVAASLDFYFKSADRTVTTSFGPGPYTVSADDAARTVTVKLGTPFADAIWGFDDQYPGQHTSIICPAGLAALKADPTALDTPDTTYGTGPYVVESATPGGDVTLKLRDEFAWGPNDITAKSPGMPGKIKYTVQNNITTTANLVKAGQVNVAVVSGPDAERLSGDGALTHAEIKSSVSNPLMINHAEGHVTADPTVRQAIITAIDPALYVKAMQQPAGLTTSVVAPDVECYDPETENLAPTPSVDDARNILEDAGWTMEDGVLVKDGEPLTLEFTTTSGYGDSAEYLADAWTQMGAKVDLTQVDNGTWISAAFAGKYDVTVRNNVLVSPTVALGAQVFSSEPPPNGVNSMFLPNYTEYADLVAQIESLEGDAACEPAATLQRELWANWDVLPLYVPVIQVFGNGVDVSGLQEPEHQCLLVQDVGLAEPPAARDHGGPARGTPGRWSRQTRDAS